MFHVKHSVFLSEFINQLCLKVQNNSGVRVKGLSLYLLNFIVKKFNKKCFVVVKDDVFINRDELFWGRPPSEYIKLADSVVDTPVGFLSPFSVNLKSAQAAVIPGKRRLTNSASR